MRWNKKFYFTSIVTGTKIFVYYRKRRASFRWVEYSWKRSVKHPFQIASICNINLIRTIKEPRRKTYHLTIHQTRIMQQHFLDRHVMMYTKRNIFEILLNHTEIRLYLPFCDRFGIKRTSVWFQINRNMVYKIWFRCDLISFRKYFSLCKTWKIRTTCEPKLRASEELISYFAHKLE